MTMNRLRNLGIALALGGLLAALVFGGMTLAGRSASADQSPKATVTPTTATKSSDNVKVPDSVGSTTVTKSSAAIVKTPPPVDSTPSAAEICKEQAAKNQPTSPIEQVQDAISTAVGEAAANAVGLSPQQYKQELKAGQSISQLARAHGVTLQQVRTEMRNAADAALHAAVQRGTITSAQASDLIQNFIPSDIDGMLQVPASSPQEQTAMNTAAGAMWQAAATKLGISLDQLKRSMGNESPAELAAASRLTVQQLTDVMIAAGQASLNSSVQQGLLTQSKANALSLDIGPNLAAKLLGVGSGQAAAPPAAGSCGS